MTGITAALLYTGCASDSLDGDMPPPDDDFEAGGKEDSPLDPGWTTIGLGVAYQQVNTGGAIIIAYGGYTAQTVYSADWATELVDARLGAAGVGKIYAVKGPRDAGYNAREIQNSKLHAHLSTIDDGTSPIYVVAHSSGTYVAHELLDQLRRAGKTSILNRISYANLDGGGSGLDDDLVESLHKIAFVYARDPARGYSQNHSTAVALGQAYPASGGATQVTVSGTGCNAGAGWCLHDVVITHRPHNHASYDLADDYRDFADRPVTTEYFDRLMEP